MSTESFDPAGEHVEALYDGDPQREWERMDRHRTEFAVTMRALCEHLPQPPASILDCGGGPGRYAIELARMGHRVTLFDLSSANLSLAQTKAQEAGVALAAYQHGTATDLSCYPDETFDAVLLMGPLYHLFEAPSRSQALREASRVVVPGGRVFAAFVTRYAPLRWAAREYVDWLTERPEDVQQILESGFEPLRSAPGSRFVAYYASPGEVKPLLGTAGLELVALLGVEGLVSMIDARVNELSDTTWDRWVDLNYQVAPDPCLHGGVEHLLAIATRPAWRAVAREIAAELCRLGIRYRLVGGASVALQGADVPVRDIDIEMDVDGARRFQERYAARALLPIALRESDLYRSHFGRFAFGEVTVEVMADLHRREAGSWVPASACTVQTVDLDGAPAPVSWLEEETLAYIRRGRLARAAACLPHADRERMLRLIRGQEPTNVI